MGSVPEQMNALSELNVLMEQAWSMPIYGEQISGCLKNETLKQNY